MHRQDHSQDAAEIQVYRLPDEPVGLLLVELDEFDELATLLIEVAAVA